MAVHPFLGTRVFRWGRREFFGVNSIHFSIRAVEEMSQFAGHEKD
jgi:hypothetical protein